MKDTSRAFIHNKQCVIIGSVDSCAVDSGQGDVVRVKKFTRSITKQTNSHLHLLVDLPLYGVRRFPAAFIFRWSPFLHLWHSPGSGWIRSGSVSPRVQPEVSLFLFAERLRVKAVTPGDSGCHSRPSESLIWGFTPYESTEHACAPGWRLRCRTISALSPPTPSTPGGGDNTASGGDFQSKVTCF